MATKLENEKWDVIDDGLYGMFFAIPNKIWKNAREADDFSIVHNFIEEHFIYSIEQFHAIQKEWNDNYLGDEEAGSDPIEEIEVLVQ